jgi:hypothetical protein
MSSIDQRWLMARFNELGAHDQGHENHVGDHVNDGPRIGPLVIAACSLARREIRTSRARQALPTMADLTEQDQFAAIDLTARRS